MRHLIFMIPLLWNLISYCQERVQVGQKCPDIKLTGVINYRDSNVTLLQFKGKAIIIDFWNTGCSACIEGFYRIDSLQRMFNNSIQFLLVNSESKDSTERFFKSRKKIIIPDVPMITGDHILGGFFPHYGFPYQVWLDRDGIVRYITPAYNATSEHLEMFLSGQDLPIQNYTSDNSLKISEEIKEWGIKMDYYSFISHCDESNSIKNLEKSEVDSNSITISCNCLSVAELFKNAFREYDKHNFDTRGSLVLEVKDSFKYVRPTDPNLLDKWKGRYCYSYALLLPRSRAKKIYNIMQDDLSRFFGIHASIEKREVKCMVLVRRPDVDKLPAGNDSSTDKSIIANNYNITNDTIPSIESIRSNTFRHDLSALIESATSMPFYDEVGHVNNINIEIRNESVDPFSLKDLKADLNKYGLDLVEKNKLIDVLVLVARED